MDLQSQPAKMVAVDADLFESVGYEDFAHCMYIKFRNGPTTRFEKVPRFRYQGLVAAPRKDAYYRTFVQNQFLSKPV